MTGDGTVTYSSSNAAVAEVNATTGEVTIKGDGEATIKATVTDGPTYTYVTNEASYTLGVGTATMTVTADGYSGTYDGNTHGISVKAPDGATIKYGIATGSYTLDACPTYTDACEYTVYYQVTKEKYTTVTGSVKVTISKAEAEISYAIKTVPKNNADGNFTNMLTNTGDGAVTYKSSDDSVAEVDADGKVIINGVGTATITATVADGKNYSYAAKTAEYTITVSSLPSNVGDLGDYENGGNPF